VIEITENSQPNKSWEQLEPEKVLAAFTGDYTHHINAEGVPLAPDAPHGCSRSGIDRNDGKC